LSGGSSVPRGRERARLLLDAFSDAGVLVDRDGRILEMNREASVRLGGARSDLIGTPFDAHAPPGIAKARKAFIDGAFESGKPFRFEEGGEGSRMENLVVPLVGEGGTVETVAFIARDITARKNAEERALRSERQMNQAAKMVSLGTLVSGVAHEINNPTNFIMMNTPLLSDVWDQSRPVLDRYFEEHGDFELGGLPYSEMRENVPLLFAGVREGAKRIERIIGNLKGFARQDVVETWETLDLNAVVEGAVSLMGQFVRKSTDRFSVALCEDLPPLQGNFQKLEQVVINLLQNACQALPGRDRAVTVSTGFNAATESAVLTVSDEGEGIEPSTLPKIMDPFVTTRRSSGGTGLGLSIVSNIVKEHSGEITISSRPGEGSVFVVTLPLRTAVPQTKILVADDDAGMRKLMTRILGRNRLYNLKAASNGMEACLKLSTYRPRLLLLDINMPEMDGREVCSWIQSEPSLASMRVIIVTGHPGSSKLDEIRALGFVHILAKPFTPQELEELVRSVLAV
jgi:PAS domain S-box-containing protein